MRLGVEARPAERHDVHVVAVVGREVLGRAGLDVDRDEPAFVRALRGDHEEPLAVLGEAHRVRDVEDVVVRLDVDERAPVVAVLRRGT